MQMLLAKRSQGNYTGRYPRTLRNHNGEHLVNLIKYPWNASHIHHSE